MSVNYPSWHGIAGGTPQDTTPPPLVYTQISSLPGLRPGITAFDGSACNHAPANVFDNATAAGPWQCGGPMDGDGTDHLAIDFGVGNVGNVHRFRVQQWAAFASTRCAEFVLQRSDDAAAWTTVYTWSGGDFSDTGEVDMPGLPVNARYWRVMPTVPTDPASNKDWLLTELTLWEAA